MTETRPRNGARTRAEIREVAAALFYTQGYESTSLRSVAAEVGIKVGSLYNHMGSKDELLLDIMMSVMEALQPMVEEAAENAGDDPVDRLRAVVDAHVRFHAQHARETFIGNSEIRSLLPDQRAQIRKLRDAYEVQIRGYIEAAATAAGVDVLDLRLQTYSVLALGMHTASWFRESSGVSLAHVAATYTEMVLRQIGIGAGESSATSQDRAPRKSPRKRSAATTPARKATRPAAS
jgi:AcrR family transcriptional regulator